jgi:hypothetical protein
MSWPRPLIAFVCLTVGVVAMSTVVGVTLAAAPASNQQTRSTDQLVDPQGLDQAAAAPVLTQTASIRDLLKFPVGARRNAQHLNNNSTGDNYDQVDELDAQAHPVATIQVSGGKLISAIRLDIPPQSAAPINRGAGIAAGQKAAADLGLATTAPDRAFADDATGGWITQWDRTENGIPVRGDGVAVRVWADGRIASVGSSSHALAAAPTTTISAVSATSAIKASLSSTAAGSSAVRTDTPTLEWVRPNGVFDSSRPFAPDQVSRLAWVVNVKPAAGTDAPFTMLTFFVDAGSGSLIGGDVVE